MEEQDLSFLIGKVVKSIKYEEIYSGNSIIITFEDGYTLQIDSNYDGGVFGDIYTDRLNR